MLESDFTYILFSNTLISLVPKKLFQIFVRITWNKNRPYVILKYRLKVHNATVIHTSFYLFWKQEKRSNFKELNSMQSMI